MTERSGDVTAALARSGRKHPFRRLLVWLAIVAVLLSADGISPVRVAAMAA